MMSRVLLLLSFSVALALELGAQQPDSASQKPNAAQPDTIFARARQLVLEGNGAVGRAIIDSVVAQTPVDTPRYPEALYWRALLASTAANAERDYRRIIVEYPLSPRSGDALFSLSQLEMARGDRDNATAHLERFMREYPDSPDRARAGLALSRMLIEAGRVARGCATLGRARPAIPADAVELKNQFDYYAPRCAGVDTVEAAATKPAAPPAAVPPPVTAAQRPESARASAPRGAVTRTDSARPSAQATTRAPAPVTPRTPTTTPATKSQYTLQVGAFETKAEADQVADRLRKRGLASRVYGTVRPFRVRIGRFASQEAANDLLKQLRTQGVNGFVTAAEPEAK